MTTLATIGSGNIGSTVAQLAIDAGYDVVLSNSRGPETLSGLVADLGPRARAASAEEAAQAGDLVLVSVPLKAYRQVPAAPLAGKVVMDTNNYYPQRDGSVAELDAKQTTTSQLLQDRLPGSQVVKVFNNIMFQHLATMGRPSGAADRSTLLIAGDDQDAKRTVGQFLDAIGYDAYDAGPLAESWRFERDQPAYVGAYTNDGDIEHPVPADTARLRGLLAKGVR